MSITIHLPSVQDTIEASSDLGSPSRCGALNFANVNAAIVLSIATGWEIDGGIGGIGPGEIVDAIERIGAALDCTPQADMVRATMESPANESPPSRLGARVIMKPQTEERARERLAAMLMLLSIAFARGEGLVWS